MVIDLDSYKKVREFLNLTRFGEQQAAKQALHLLALGYPKSVIDLLETEIHLIAYESKEALRESKSRWSRDLITSYMISQINEIKDLIRIINRAQRGVAS